MLLALIRRSLFLAVWFIRTDDLYIGVVAAKANTDTAIVCLSNLLGLRKQGTIDLLSITADE